MKMKRIHKTVVKAVEAAEAVQEKHEGLKVQDAIKPLGWT